jgi:RNA polymerase sigma-70 factor (ECF subfamily)
VGRHRVRGLEAQRNREASASHPGRDTVLEEVEHRADRTHVHECLERLTDVQRAAVLLAYFGGRTYREVADELGTALPAARSRIRDGLDRLHTCLGVE